MNLDILRNNQKNLQFADQFWHNFRNNNQTIKKVIYQQKESINETDFDVVICGGTLGIFLGTTLRKKGYKVAVIEKGILQGREQEWNISRNELSCLLELDLIDEKDLEQIIFTEYNPGRVSFYQGYELWVKDVLNIGVSPKLLLAKVKNKFLQLGGILLEKTSFISANIYDNGVKLELDNQVITSRLLIDAMGHFSPIAKQARQGQQAEGVCLVVGSCGEGFEKNDTGDLIATITPIQNRCQYFWEAFPAKDGRTTYLFTYVDAHPDRISLTDLTQEYLRLLPKYQNVDLGAIAFKRFLFGFFPSYNNSPLKMPWSRILAIGDSSGSQSPVSFGGFGSMMRHLPRLNEAINEALQTDSLSPKDLHLIQPYQPNISVTWLFQKTMSVGIDKNYSPNQINDLMSGVFKVMDKMGDDVLKPFLQDVVKFSGLAKTLPLVNPLLVLPLLPQVGLPIFADWFKHFTNLGLFTGLYPLAKSFKSLESTMNEQQLYYYHRYLDMWKYGAGKDNKG
ncbi:FAD-binding oxidoreductase [Cyanobacterium stanieri LEGE 03274]|uniref:FAD-binding oxidoreductase n=1 Tax=Cyanobacterium stanieri LEGE 03274 TaxID=1828756 RepID=A0ABR9V422_9CHRO|nr:FAD-binding oxidoreductase [Cyanobacterium stanieri]MBE9222640.1 FAD-binding oxidoreductase [Cyanobacterium stanieri LEGE 03274]